MSSAHTFAAALVGVALAACPLFAAAPAYRLTQEPGQSVSLLAGDQALWTLHHRKAEGKPYFHPVCTPDGTCLTWLRPGDHRWHRALWFSWKHINGLNYWEENRQGLSQGRTEVADVKARQAPDGSTAIVMLLDYHPPDKPAVLKERRTIAATLPDDAGAYRMDWTHVFTAQDAAVELSRTPTKAEGGPAWGGYAGLSFRAVKAMTAYQTLDSEGRRNMAGHGQHARWLDFSGTVDPKTKRAAGVAFFDHPSNPRHPTPMYIIMSGHFGYCSPAFLFDKPHTLPKGQSLTLFYRVLIHPGRATKAQLDKEFEAFKKLKPNAPR